MVARRLALAFFIAAALFAHAQASSWNVTSRMAAIESLVNRGTFAIDASPFKTGDKYRYAGHYYSDKPPILTVAGACVALALRVARVDVVRQARIVMFAVTVVTVAIPFALGIAALFGVLRLLAIEARWAAAVATIAGSATLAFPFATVLINHVPAAALLLGALYLLTRARLEARGTPAAGAGALLAVAFGIDTSFVIFILVAPLALGRASVRTYLAYVAGTLPVLAVIATSDLALSGNIRPPRYQRAALRLAGFGIRARLHHRIAHAPPARLGAALWLQHARRHTRPVPVLAHSDLRPLRTRPALARVPGGSTSQPVSLHCGRNDPVRGERGRRNHGLRRLRLRHAQVRRHRDAALHSAGHAA